MSQNRKKSDSSPLLAEVGILISWLSENFPTGEWGSRFRGQGYDLQGTVPFWDDPDPRRFNYQATVASGGEPQVSVYQEVRNVDLCVLGDLTPSMVFGSSKHKIERLALICALFAFSAYRAKDDFHFIGYTDRVITSFPEPGGREYPYQLAQAISEFVPDRAGSRADGLLCAVEELPRQKSFVVLASDLLGDLATVKQALELISDWHEVFPIVLWDGRELELPQGWGLLPLGDLETGREVYLPLTDRTRRIHRRNVSDKRKQIKELFHRFGLEPLFLAEVGRTDFEELFRAFFTRMANI